MSVNVISFFVVVCCQECDTISEFAYDYVSVCVYVYAFVFVRIIVCACVCG